MKTLIGVLISLIVLAAGHAVLPTASSAATSARAAEEYWGTYLTPDCEARAADFNEAHRPHNGRAHCVWRIPMSRDYSDLMYDPNYVW